MLISCTNFPDFPIALPLKSIDDKYRKKYITYQKKVAITANQLPPRQKDLDQNSKEK